VELEAVHMNCCDWWTYDLYISLPCVFSSYINRPFHSVVIQLV
jgi:hypothetical protein